MNSNQLRSVFLEFFKQNGHEVVPSSSLVPSNDPTLLFTNAGMVQFKEVFLGLEQRSYTRAASSQRCVRAGGKHNDLENVGYTARHHTFFEMLGNFSFGDYFKREAIQYAWMFLTEVLGLPKEKLWVTVFQEDTEAEKIWLEEMKVDPKRFSRCGEKDNFWSMGDTGPCGPCSEIFYDHGPEVAGGPPGSPEQEGDRYIEIWNLVFMQYDRSAAGELTPLPKPSVDTGMGLERIAAVLQGVHNNYEIDLFQHIIRFIAQLAGERDLTHHSLRVIADHIRSCAFLIVDGVVPSNEGRGYVLRRIIRRAIRHGHALGLREPFFHKVVTPLVEQMGDAYPELRKAQQHVQKVLLQEEQQFAKTLEQGLKLFEQDIANLAGKIIPGEVIFKLYDTYGFPADLTGDMARERGLALDLSGFEKEMEKQRQRSKEASQFTASYGESIRLDIQTDFTGYEHFGHDATVAALMSDSQLVESLNQGEDGAVLLDRSPFYAESGGQVGDSGLLLFKEGEFEVLDTRKQGDAHLHIGRVTKGTLQKGMSVEAKIDIVKRRATMLNHTATHLLHAALREVLGEHVLQKGSLVEPERLRFDFAHYEPVTAQQLKEIERLVNQKIRENIQVETDLMTPEQAKKTGAMALFGEKYGEKVRVLSVGEFSKELCGGTHVRRTGDIGFLKITAESGVAAGVRRLEAITGEYAQRWQEQASDQLNALASQLKTKPEDVAIRVKEALDRTRILEKEMERLKAKLASQVGGDLSSQAQDIGGIKVLATKLDDVDPKSLRDTLDQLKNKLGSAAIVLATVNEGRVSLVAGVTKDCTARVKAGDLVNHVAMQVGGKGGGRPDMAQAGGNDPASLDAALASVLPWVAEQISATQDI